MWNLNFLKSIRRQRFNIQYAVIGVFCFAFYSGCNEKALIPSNDSTFNRYYPNLTVFIGELVPNQHIKKDSIVSWPNSHFMSDGFVRVKYLVKEWIYGLEQPPDTIDMISYDHFSSFPFLDTKYAMLYVTKNQDGSYTQLKYRSHPVYPLTHGRWASPPNVYVWQYNTNHLVPRILPYLDSIRIPVGLYPDSTFFPDELKLISLKYPKPYYYLHNTEIVSVYGNDVIEIFEKDKAELLASARFDEKYVDENGVVHLPTPPTIDSITLIEVEENDMLSEYDKILPLENFKTYAMFRIRFHLAIKHKRIEELKQMMLTELMVCDSTYTQDEFIKFFLPVISYPFEKSTARNFENFTKKNWQEFYLEIYNSLVILKDSLGSYNESERVIPNLNFSNPLYELYIIDNYHPKENHQKEFNFDFVLKEGRFFLYGIHFSTMRDCYKPQ